MFVWNRLKINVKRPDIAPLFKNWLNHKLPFNEFPTPFNKGVVVDVGLTCKNVWLSTSKSTCKACFLQSLKNLVAA